MKRTALISLLAILAQTFCLPMQQSIAQVVGSDPVSANILDSGAYLENAIKHSPPRDDSQKIEALIKRMTLEEKVGQMTQLEIGVVTSGSGQTTQIDPEKLDKAVVK